MQKALLDTWLRIDARSLGLFRASFGAVLIGDLFRRWQYAKELYSNEGVLPNHNHIYLLRDKPGVWSLLHAVSSPGEADFVFLVILCCYAAYLVGWRTRVFQILAIVCLVSLTGRNILLENAGNYVAIALLGFTAFLPLGSRFSLDSLLHSLDARDEKTGAELSDRRRPSDDAIQEARLPGWSPVSLAAFAVLALIAVIYATAAVLQSGAAWKDGSALHYALNNERWVSAAGAAARGFLGPNALSAWTRAFHGAELLIPILIFVPVATRLTRGLAVGLALFHALTLAIFFSFGLYGFSLAAAAMLLIPRGTWDLIEDHPNPRRARTVIYDADCGICLALTRLLKRLDLRGNLTFQGNDDMDALFRRSGAEIARSPMPAEVTFDLVQNTVVAVDPQGQIQTRARAVAEVIQALPLGWSVAWIMRLPGVVDLLNKGYDFIAERRREISVAMGKAACGIPGLDGPKVLVDPTRTEETAPATRLARVVTGALRDGGAALLLAAMLAQTAHENPLPWKVGAPEWLLSVARWPRMMARWDVIGNPPTDDEAFVVDAETKDGRSVDPFTGRPPVMDPGAMRGTGLGQLWNDYLYRIHQKEWSEFQRAFKDYLTHGGPKWEDQTGDAQLLGYDAYWVKQPIPRPGEARDPGRAEKEKWITQSRGGRAGQR